MARLFSIRPAWTFRGREFHGMRGWSGKPSHPPFTDFPIVCYVVAAVFDVISFAVGSGDDPSPIAFELYRAATFVLAAGLLFAVPTALTGFWDWWKGMDRDRSVGVFGRAKHTQVWRTANWHAVIMVTATIVVIVDLVIRAAGSDEPSTPVVAMILSVIPAGLVTFGAAYGGALVYEYQFNVEPLKDRTYWDETEVDQGPGGQELR